MEMIRMIMQLLPETGNFISLIQLQAKLISVVLFLMQMVPSQILILVLLVQINLSVLDPHLPH